MQFISVFFLLALLVSGPNLPYEKYQLQGAAQGTSWAITYYAKYQAISKQQVDSILVSIDSSLSLYKPYSLINRFNESPTGVRADRHLRTVVQKALQVHRETGGLFDITVQPLVDAWGFGASSPKAPSGIPTWVAPGAGRIDSLLACTGSDRLLLKQDSLLKTSPCLKIDLDGIAQGYSVDVIAEFLTGRGIKNFIVELGGEIRVKGTKRPTREKMRIGIESPASAGPLTLPPTYERVVTMARGGLTTSGNYRKFIVNNGKKLGHTIDPRTGYPVDNGIISVSVRARDAMTADAYDNALMLMGVEEAMAFVKKKPALSAYFIYTNAAGEISDTATTGFFR